MIKKTSVILLCGITSVLCMEKLDFMKNGQALAATMTKQQKIDFMRNGGQGEQFDLHIVHQIIDPIPTDVIETKPIEQQMPLEEEKVENIEPFPIPLNTDDISIENDLINYAIKLSLDDNHPSKEKDTQNDQKPQLNEIIQKISNVPGKNIVINYNVTIKQKVKNSVQNINIGKNNSNY